MFALRPDHASVAVSPRFVLPRWLRRPARAVSRLFGPDVEAPRFAATFLTGGLLLATGIYGAAIGGHMPELVKSVTARTGFAVVDVRVSGNRETSEIDVVESLGLDGYTALIGLDVREARERVAALPWVESVTIRKVYPDAIDVSLVERTAFAIWQHEGELTLIESNGRPIAPLTGNRFADLPLVVGEGAPDRAADFLRRVAAYPQLAGRVRGYVRVAGRRWDLHMANGVVVRLPDNGEDAALAAFAQMQDEHDVLGRDIVAVDLRLRDRVTIQLSAEAASERQDMMKQVVSGKKGRRI